MERLTRKTKTILAVLYERAPMALYGLEIANAGKVASGTLYPALRQLRRAGLVEAEWRPPDDDPDGQPLRYYRLSPNGHALAKALADNSVAGTAWRAFLPAGPSAGLS